MEYLFNAIEYNYCISLLVSHIHWQHCSLRWPLHKMNKLLFLCEDFFFIAKNVEILDFWSRKLTGRIFFSFIFLTTDLLLTITNNLAFRINRCWFIFHLKWFLKFICSFFLSLITYVRYATISKMKIEFCTNSNLKHKTHLMDTHVLNMSSNS